MTEAITRTLSLDGLSFSYQVVPAENPRIDPVLVIGGVLQGMHGWSIMERHVLPHADLISVDLPGAGQSTPLRPEQGLETMCRVTEVIIDDLGLERVNFLGYSFGSAVAYRCAQRRPERLAKLALGGVPVRISDKLVDLWNRGAQRMASGDAKGFVNVLTEMFLCADSRATIRNRDIVRQLVTRMTLRGVTANAHGFTTMERSVLENLDPEGGLRDVPTLVFCGEHDTISSLAEQREFAQTIENCTFAAIAESDHWVFMQRRDEASDLVMRFFTDQPLEDRDYLVEPAAAVGTAAAAGVRN
ncbi:alpha/beta fold hydrolase [Streptomyces sp. TLI_146]|uniref:alpha/beta fold hydrolase n=1 Tax=Streptomyces sp. TLI_146 TaxID=1938858 RepID=UPI000C71238E|nr:alpha/beta hydrolase [Streptomyces sp. TLI_146]PKV83379.1 pimeloyl-ACP methyl ester carboxylesterase [Streptomyces sp. TLI_146]